MENRKGRLLSVALFILTILFSASMLWAQEQNDVQMHTKPVTEEISVIRDLKNGNTVVFSGKDGVLVVDTKSKELAKVLYKEIAKISKEPVRFVVNTHWHFDHVAGNEFFGKAGATIIAHKNVHQRMSTTQTIEMFDLISPPAPKMALPVLTFTEELILHLNGEEVRLFQVAPGHTDGDGIVYFSHANVIHLGDLYFNGIYPYIGIPTGGSIDGMISVGQHVLDMINDKTTIIPGHGPLATKTEYAEFLNMLAAIRNAVEQLVTAGKSLDNVIASKPTRPFDDKWGNGFLKPKDFVGLVYKDLARK